MVELELETVVRAPPGRVFDVSLDIDVHQASMQRSGERAVAGVTGGMIGSGSSSPGRPATSGSPGP